MAETVLVTGGTGFLAGWTIVELLKRGYVVRTTVRNLDKEPRVCAQIAKEIDPGDRLTFVVAELTDDAGWDAAVDGCDFVLHVAAPVGVEAPATLTNSSSRRATAPAASFAPPVAPGSGTSC